MTLLPDSWRRVWRLTAGADDGQALFERLLAAYDEPHRHYHSRRHLEECLARFAAVRDQAAHPDEVEAALWFHDAVYALRADDNELLSADWARRALLAAGADPAVAERVHALVMATRHRALPVGPDERLLVDVDLSILGAPEARFDEYETQVRREYDWVPPQAFRRGRAEVLRGFLARESIYSTEAFHSALEAAARENLRRSLARLVEAD